MRAPAIKSLAALLLMLFLSSCVTSGGSSAIQSELNNVKHDVIQNRKDINGLKGTLTNDEVIEAIRTSQTSLFTQVSGMTGDVQTSMAQLDELQHSTRKALEKIGSEVDLLKSKMDESGAGSKGLTEINARLDALESSLGIIKTQLAAILKGSHAESAKSGNKAEALYKKAYKEFEKRRFTEARQQFQTFISEHPRHKLTGNAMFWIGETHFHQKRYDSAILAYQDVIEKFPANTKVPASLLKQAYAFIEMGEKVAARGTLKTLLAKHPKSKVAEAAAAKLKELK